MLRYRTEGISTKDMTYLFIVIAMGLISTVSKATYFELAIINIILIGFTYALDGNWLVRNEMIKTVQYENIEMIKPEHHQALIEDLKNGQAWIFTVWVLTKSDFLKDIAVIKIYFYEDTVASKNHDLFQKTGFAFLVLFLSVSGMAKAQEDAGLWTSLTLQHKFTQNGPVPSVSNSGCGITCRG